MKTLPVLLTVAGIAALLPIWRGAGHTRHDGVNAFRLLYDTTKGVPGGTFGHPHLPYDQAVLGAQEAWRALYGS